MTGQERRTLEERRQNILFAQDRADQRELARRGTVRDAGRAELTEAGNWADQWERPERVQLLRDPIELSEDDNTYRLTQSVRLGEVDVL
jgi:hypothetical protein